LQVENEEFPAHKAILAAYSDYFLKMFTIDMKEKHNKAITIQGVTAKAMKEVLNYIYTGTFKLSEDSLNDVLNAAALMQLNNLLGKCEEFMQNILNAKNCYWIYCLAERYFLDNAIDYVDCCLQDEFLFSDEPDILQFGIDKIKETLESDDFEVKKEEDVFEFIVKWVKYDIEQRKRYFPKLFKLIRLQFIAVEFLKRTILQNDLARDSQDCHVLVENACAFHAIPSYLIAQKPRNCFIHYPDTVLLLPYQKSYHWAYIDENESKQWKKLTFCGLTEETVLEGCATATYESRTVLCGGVNEKKNATSEVVQFDGVRWMSMPQMNNVRCGAAAEIFNNDLFVFGGETVPSSNNVGYSGYGKKPAFSATFEKLDIDWERKEKSKWESFELPLQRSYFSAQFLQGKIYLIGGYTPIENNKIDDAGERKIIGKIVCNYCIAYCSSTNTFNKAGNLNEARACFGCETIGNELFVVGGIGLNGTSLTSLEYLNTDQPDIWSVIFQDFPFDISYRTNDGKLSTCLIGSKLYLVTSHQHLVTRSFDENCYWSENNPAAPVIGVLIPFSLSYIDKQTYAKVLQVD